MKAALTPMIMVPKIPHIDGDPSLRYRGDGEGTLGNQLFWSHAVKLGESFRLGLMNTRLNKL